jgi:hypothetical protein
MWLRKIIEGMRCSKMELHELEWKFVQPILIMYKNQNYISMGTFTPHKFYSRSDGKVILVMGCRLQWVHTIIEWFMLRVGEGKGGAGTGSCCLTQPLKQFMTRH